MVPGRGKKLASSLQVENNFYDYACQGSTKFDKKKGWKIQLAHSFWSLLLFHLDTRWRINSNIPPPVPYPTGSALACQNEQISECTFLVSSLLNKTKKLSPLKKINNEKKEIWHMELELNCQSFSHCMHLPPHSSPYVRQLVPTFTGDKINSVLCPTPSVSI